MAQLPAATVLLLLLPTLFCDCECTTDPTNTTTPLPMPAIVSTTKASVSTPNASNSVAEPIPGTSPHGAASTSSEGLSMTPPTAGGGAGSTISGHPSKNESVITEETMTNSSLSSVLPTLQSSQNMTVNQSSMETTKTSGAGRSFAPLRRTSELLEQTRQNSLQVSRGPSVSSEAHTSTFSTQQQDPSPSEATVVPSTRTASENASHSQGIEDVKNTSSLSTGPSYSSIILPVVIVLIVITLSVFVLVGLYQMCWKKDPGTPENGSDQPQSNKESVKLLTVKTISHEPGEHGVAEKSKN